MTALLEARQVTKVFGSGRNANVALDHLSFALDADHASFTSVAGESGSGKTTLARLLLGFIEPTEGDVLYRGKSLRRLSRGEWMQFRREVQAIFQDPFEVFNPFYKVDHLLEQPIAKFHLAKSRDDGQTQMREALMAVGLRPEETLGRYPHQLSGGQRQRLTIARALLLHPRLIIADEPVSMVDASLRATILESLQKLYQDFNISFVYITHDLTTAYQISNNLIVLYRGTVAEAGDVDLVVKQPRHPYSQLLVSSIPRPDTGERWGEEKGATDNANNAVSTSGCKYADRCPFVFDRCTTAPPPLFRIAPRQVASCYLLRESPTVKMDELDQVLTA